MEDNNFQNGIFTFCCGVMVEGCLVLHSAAHGFGRVVKVRSWIRQGGEGSIINQRRCFYLDTFYRPNSEKCSMARNIHISLYNTCYISSCYSRSRKALC